MEKRKSKKRLKPNEQEERRLTAQTTVSQWRLPLFKGVKRTDKKDINNQIILSFNHGTCMVKHAILTQTHRNIIDAIFTVKEKKQFSNEGDLTVFFNPVKLFKLLGINSKHHHEWLKEKLDEMRIPILMIHAPHMQRKVHSVIASEHGYPDELGFPNYDAFVREKWKFNEGMLYAIRFTRSYMRLFFIDLPMELNYDIIKKIISYESGILQAFIRFCLTHRKLKTGLDLILRSINVITENTSRQCGKNIKHKIMNKAKQLDEDFGIKIENGIVSYSQHSGIFIDEPVDVEFLPGIKDAGSLEEAEQISSYNHKKLCGKKL